MMRVNAQTLHKNIWKIVQKQYRPSDLTTVGCAQTSDFHHYIDYSIAKVDTN